MAHDELLVFDADHAKPNRQNCRVWALVHRAAQLGLIKNGKFGHASIFHDDWCTQLKNPTDDCNCDPELEIDGHKLRYSEMIAPS